MALRKHLFFLALLSVAATLARAAAPAADPAGESVRTAPDDGPATVGRFEPLAIETPHPYPSSRTAGEWTRLVTDPGATYVRVHFTRFDLADGDALEIADPSGSQSHLYTRRGPLGAGEFWAFTVPGDTAILTLHASSGGAEGFQIDGYGRGAVPIFGSGVGSAPERPRSVAPLTEVGTPEPLNEPIPDGLVCGRRDWDDVACYAQRYPSEVQHARAVALVVAGCCGAYTAFKVSDGGQFLTTAAGPDQAVPSYELWLDYENAECGSNPRSPTAVRVDRVLQTNHAFGYRLLSVVGDTSAIPCLQLDRHQPSIGDRIYIPEFTGGPKKLALTSDRNDPEFCAIDRIPPVYFPTTNYNGYFCDTPSLCCGLGAPVISRDTHRVVGINWAGMCPNLAVRMDLIWPQIESLVGTCSTCDPGPHCDCDGICSKMERKFAARGGLCPDCPAAFTTPSSTFTPTLE